MGIVAEGFAAKEHSASGSLSAYSICEQLWKQII
jgi:hypothetical protein